MNPNNDSADYHDESAPHLIENETIESWTFLGDESKDSTHPGSRVDDIVEHHDEDRKLSSKTSRSSSSGLS